MTHHPHWSDAAIELIAHRFKLLSEPSRLRLLYALYDGEKTVGELIEITQMAQANVSHQLTLLADGGLIVRRKTQQKVIYRLADPALIDLNDLVCQHLLLQGTHVLASLQDEQMPTVNDKEGACHVAIQL